MYITIKHNILYSLEKKSEKLAKESKGYLDSMRGTIKGVKKNHN